MSLGVTKRIERVARKAHTCVDCSNQIASGEPYLEFKSAYTDEDGKFGHFSVKIHHRCQEQIDKEDEEYQREMCDLENDHWWEHRYP